jgi:hypothetical protein
MSTEEIKKKLTFDLWNADFFNTSFMFELEHYAEKYGAEYVDNKNPAVYYGWRNLLDRISREEALQWLEEICNQIDEGKLKYEWDDTTKKFIR